MENHDIDDLVNGKGVLNWEHSNKGEDIIGAVIYARKILKKEDCENDRQRKYWDFVKKPFVYIIGELFEDEEHPGAIAVAAMIRYYAKKNEKLLTGFSIEGATLERRDYILQESVGRRVAVTLRPCNHTAIAGLYEDPKAKSIAKSIEDMSKAVDASLIEVDSIILEDMFMPQDPILELYKALEDLNKTLTAGMGNVAPGQLTGGAALTKEHITGFQRNRLKAIVRDWDRRRPLKEVVKAALPEVSDDYIGHFTDLAEELALKKSSTTKLIRIGASHSPNKHASDEQKKLIEGLYFDPKKDPKAFRPGHDEYSNALYKLRNDAGQDVLVKNPRTGAGLSAEDMGVWDEHQKDNAERASHYYHLADQVFGMGKHVPVTNYFHHEGLSGEKTPEGYLREPGSGDHHQAMEIIPKAKTGLALSDKDIDKHRAKWAKSGESHKMMMMDAILGNAVDRHLGNILVHPKGHLVNIDNDLAFNHGNGGVVPYYINEAGENQDLHPEARAWIKSIDPKHLVGKMLDQGHDVPTIKASAAALKAFQKMADKPMSVGNAYRNAESASVAAKNEAQYKQDTAGEQAKPKKAV